MQVRQNSGLLQKDVMDIKVFLRTYNDAIDCAQLIAEKDSQVNHYKSYIKTLTSAIKEDKIMIDKHSDVIAASDPTAANIYQLLKFSQSIFFRYGFDKIEDRKDLDKKIDKCITGLEKEIASKRSSINKLMNDLKINNSESKNIV